MQGKNYHTCDGIDGFCAAIETAPLHRLTAVDPVNEEKQDSSDGEKYDSPKTEFIHDYTSFESSNAQATTLIRT
jgi:hypothetical protein